MNGLNWHYVEAVTSWSRHDRGLRLDGRTHDGLRVSLALEVWTPYVWRLRMAAGLNPTQSPVRPDRLLSRQRWPAVPLQIEEQSNEIVLSTSDQAIHIRKQPWKLRVFDIHGLLLCSENPEDLDGLGRFNVRPLGFSVNTKGQVCNVFDSFELRADEHFYGFGEKFTPLDKRGQDITLWNVDAFGTTTERSHKNIPFFMSSRGYGLFLNTTCRIRYHMGSRSCISYSFEVEDEILDLFFILGPRPADILARYTELTGRAPVPPKWSFGLWVSSTGAYRTRQEMEEMARGLREREVPCDVLHIDPWWMRPRRYCDFRWNHEAFPHPEEMIATLKAQGFKLCLWEQPYISRESELYEEARGLGYLALREDGSVYEIDYGLSLAPLPGDASDSVTPETTWNAPVAIVDFSNPAAVHWWQEHHRPLFEMGVDVFKTDFGEDVPEDAHFANGMTGREMHNLFPLLYNRAVFEAREAFTGAPGLVWGRSTWAGGQRYPTHWAGDPAADFASLACVIRGGLSFGLSGFPFWSHDIGGYRGTPGEELYIRWAQFGLFSPHARCHGESPREPWYYGERALRIFRFYARLRYRLIPYLYSYAHVASRTGLPLMRAMLLEYPDDPHVYNIDLQYLLGRELLVAPIYDETGERDIYLPQGRWLDYWTQKEYNGPAYLRYRATLETLPLFVRAGAIIPMGPEMNFVGERPFDPLTLDIYPHGDATFTLYDDEEVVAFICHQAKDALVFELGASARAYILQFNKTGRPRRVTAGGRVLDAVRSQDDLNWRQEGWWWRSPDRLLVKVAPPRDGLTVHVELEDEGH